VTGVSRASIRDWLADRERALNRPRDARVGAFPCDGGCNLWNSVPERPYSYLLGMYLGDGTISRHRHSYRLRVFCDQKYPRIMHELQAAIELTLPVKVGRVARIGCDEVGAYSKHWPCLFPQHGEGMKHQRPILLADWQSRIVRDNTRPFIRGLIHSDGCRAMNVAIRNRELWTERRTYTRYQFTNRSDDIRGLFCWALDLIDVHWTQSNKWTISVSRRKDVHYLDSFVGPKR
jgi:hypothetical protein